jgi:hypothetical protein
VLTAEQAAVAATNLVKSQHSDYARRIKAQQDYLDGSHSSVYVPQKARNEYRWLVQRSQVNILPLVVDTLAQALYVEGWRGESVTDPPTPWQVWQANRMDARQTAVHRAALAHGEAFCVVLPGDTAPVMRPVGPLDLFALYDDPVNDEWPLLALERRPNGTWRLHEPEYSHPLVFDADAFTAGPPVRHGLGVTPVVRFVNRLDLSGRIVGEIEPLIKIQDQINSTTFGLLMAQTYAAFRQRWATGMVTEDEDGNELPPPNVSVARILTSDSPDTKFGEFEATDLGGYINSREASLRHAAIVSQVPPHHLMGQMANLSAEALAAAEAGQMRKIAERQALFGESWEQALRLTALLAGDSAAAQDMSAQVLWRDPESRSLAQYADALGKIAAQLEVPPQVLWEKLPGVTQTDVDRWKDEAGERLMADAQAQATAFGVTGVSVSELPDADDGVA